MSLALLQPALDEKRDGDTGLDAEDIVARARQFRIGADVAAELDARFALMAGEFKRLFAVLEKAFKLSKAE